MEYTFENHGTNTFLVYAVKPEDTVDTLSLGMLTHNKIPGLAGVQFTQMNANEFIKYNISAKVSVQQFLEGAVNKKRLIGVLKGIVEGLLSAEEYMIEPHDIVLDLNYMFVDVSTYQMALICVPLMHRTADSMDLATMFKRIVFQTQFDQSENCDYIAKLLNYLNRPAQFSLVAFRDILNGIEQNGTVAGGVKVATRQAAVSVQTSQPSAAPNIPVPSQQMSAPNHPDHNEVPSKKQPLVYGGMPAAPSKPNPMASPVVPPKQEKPGKSTKKDSQPPEGKISFLYLMQHYNKENAAAYKAQKEAKKAAGKEKKGKNKGRTAVADGFSYAVPGQSTIQAGPMQQGSVRPTPSGGSMPTVVPRPAEPSIPASQTMPQPPQGVTPVYAPIQPRPTMNFGETTVLMGGSVGETTVLSAAPNGTAVAEPYLIRKKNNEKIPLNKPVFRIGKERSYVDYFIGDNTAISRSHANFISRDGQYLVVDTNSTNHTFVNGMMIQSNQEVQINHGDMIRLANEDFEFRLY